MDQMKTSMTGSLLIETVSLQQSHYTEATFVDIKGKEHLSKGRDIPEALSMLGLVIQQNIFNQKKES